MVGRRDSGGACRDATLAARRPQPAPRWPTGHGRGAALKRPATAVGEASDARSCGDACRLPCPSLRRWRSRRSEADFCGFGRTSFARRRLADGAHVDDMSATSDPSKYRVRGDQPNINA
jgi:hypothetical protein